MFTGIVETMGTLVSKTDIAGDCRLVKLSQQGRQNMTRGEVEIVIRPEQIRGHDGKEFGPILPIVGLTHSYAGYFCNSVWFICEFQRACQQVHLFHGLRTFPWINTGTTEHQQLPDRAPFDPGHVPAEIDVAQQECAGVLR